MTRGVLIEEAGGKADELKSRMAEFDVNPLLSLEELADLGYSAVVYPQTLLRVALKAADRFNLEGTGNVADAARQLKTDRANLYRRMRRLRIDPTQERVRETR